MMREDRNGSMHEWKGGRMISVSQRFFWAGLLVMGAMLIQANPSRAQECGTAAAGTTRFGTYASGATYAVGAIVRFTVGEERLYRATGAITGAPGGDDGETAANGWSANLGDSAYAANEAICGTPDAAAYDAQIEYNDNDIAIIYNRAGTANYIINTGNGGEIHLLSGSVVLPSTSSANNAALTVSNVSGANDVRVVTASGTSVSNESTASGRRSHGIHARLATQGSSGSIYMDIAGDVSAAGSGYHAVFGEADNSGGSVIMTVSGDTSTTGGSSYAIYARTAGGEAHVDITGGTHRASGSQLSGDGVVVVNPSGGQATLDISSDATITTLDANLMATSATEAIAFFSTNTSTQTARTIGTGMWSGNRISNAGRVIGDFVSAEGNDLFENASGGVFIGELNPGNGNDEINNAGTMTIDGISFLGLGNDVWINSGTLTLQAQSGGGSGMDSFTNTGTLVIDHAANSNAPIQITLTEVFTFTSGTLRFVYDFTTNAASDVDVANALLNLGGATTATFTAGIVEIVPSSGTTFTPALVIPLVSRLASGADGGLSLTTEQLAAFSSPQGVLSLSSGILQITLHNTICGAASSRTAMTPGAATEEVSCSASADGSYSSGITASADNLALLYNTAATGTPFIRHTGAGGEIHLQRGTIIKPDGDDGAAVSVDTTLAGDIYITTAAGTTVSNQDTDAGQQAISAQGGSSIFMNIAGSASTVGSSSSSAVEAVILSASNSGDISITVSGDTSTTGAESDAILGTTSGMGEVHIDITAGTHVASGTQTTVDGVVNMITPNSGGMGQITLDISSGATVATVANDMGMVVATRAIRLNSRNTATTTARTIGTGDFTGSRVSNAGTVIGDFLALSDGNFLFENSGTFTGDISMSDGADEIQNSGSFTGDISMGGGDDEIQNAGVMTLTADAEFGGGTSDLFVNNGTLIINAAAAANEAEAWSAPAAGETNMYMTGSRFRVGGRVFAVSTADADELMAINALTTAPNAETTGITEASPLTMQDLETFTQSGGRIRFIFDFGEPLPSSAAGALLNLGAATATFSAGRIDFVDAGNNFVPGTGTMPLIVGDNLPASLTAAFRSGFGNLSISDGALRIEFLPTTSNEVVQGYDALLQTGWHSDRALAQAIRSRQCLEENPKICGWTHVGLRFTRHDPGAAQYDDDAYSLIMGFHLYHPLWRLSGAMGYEGGESDVRVSMEDPYTAEANRFLMGAGITTRGEPLFLNLHLDMQLRFAYAAYETNRADREREASYDSEPELVQLGLNVGVERRRDVKDPWDTDAWIADLFSPLSVVARGEFGLLWQRVDSFTEGGVNPFVMDDINEVLGFMKLHMEASSRSETAWGAFSSWARLGADVFIGEPASSLQGTAQGMTFSARGTMPQAMVGYGIGAALQVSEHMELDLRYEGGTSFGGETERHNATIRFNAAF